MRQNSRDGLCIDKHAMMGKMTGASESAVSTLTGGGAAVNPRVVRKVVGYVVHEDKLLVFTHDDIPLEVTGVQVPAGTIEVDEAPEDAVLREVLEETGLDTRIVSALGMECYDARPTKPEIHERYFFQLAPIERQVPERWSAGEENPSDGGKQQRWTCFWIPLAQSQVLCAGFGARLGRLILESI